MLYQEISYMLISGGPVILEVQVQFLDNVVCCCFLEQEASLTLLQLTQLYS